MHANDRHIISPSRVCFGMPNAAYQPRRALRSGGIRLFGGRFCSTRRLISSSESVRPAAKSARERAISSRNSGCWLKASDSAVYVLQRDDCGHRAVAFRDNECLVLEVSDVVCKRSNRRGQAQPLQSCSPLRPTISTLRCFRPTARMRTTRLAARPTFRKPEVGRRGASRGAIGFRRSGFRFRVSASGWFRS
jgi:hypothetical protein